jgi:hypothetical protein
MAASRTRTSGESLSLPGGDRSISRRAPPDADMASSSHPCGSRNLARAALG